MFAFFIIHSACLVAGIISPTVLIAAISFQLETNFSKCAFHRLSFCITCACKPNTGTLSPFPWLVPIMSTVTEPPES
ncbi:hypothetical protein AOQ84DRAFT_94850 [Glonium stellatum]|uniref:Uncharacterized protein n=1 Tax=Glonium stellatum TaxID=574774 RepID=A0A8E2JQ76_9PEZI|nr:hypothetical protein AOQ84DRAFT_94850 [Glonium stellatum]